MRTQPQIALKPRKTPVQARSTVTVEAIYEATFQVLLSRGADRVTTTSVAERAGVSVGTIYQYFPNKQSLLLSALAKHQDRVASAVDLACRRNHGRPVATMVESVVEAFVDAKMERSDISIALYAMAAGREETALVRKAQKRAQSALASMLETASDAQFADLAFTTLMVLSSMAGATRAVLESGSAPRMAQLLRKQLVLLCQSFLLKVANQA